MRILIVGAGIAGLSSYIYLRKHLPHSQDIFIVEAHDSPQLLAETPNSKSDPIDTKPPPDASHHGKHRADFSSTPFASAIVGSALGISGNGLSCLKRLDLDDSGLIHERIVARGALVSKWNINCARGWRLTEVKLCDESELGLGQKVSNDSQVADGKGKSPGGAALMMARQHLWEELRNAVIRLGGKQVICAKRVVNMKVHGLSNSQQVVLVEFADGKTESVDLVIGTDGLRSVVRKFMFGDGEEDLVTPHYEGLVGIGGWLPASVLEPVKELQPHSMSITFGPNGFFGCGYMTPLVATDHDDDQVEGLVGWWSTFPCAASLRSKSTVSKIDLQKSIDSLVERHGWWKQPFIQAILQHIRQHRDDPVGAGLLEAEYGTYTTRPVPTFSKHNGRLVLLGDAAHTFQPSSGQGASQALEEAETYARLLGHYLSAELNTTTVTTTSGSSPAFSTPSKHSALLKTAKALDSLRLSRVTMIYDRSQKMGGMKNKMNILQEFLLYGIVWAMRYMPQGWDRYDTMVMNYDLPSEVEKVIRQLDRCG